MQEYVKVLLPGDNKTEGHYEVTPFHKKRWARQYSAFKSGGPQAVDGMPVDNVAWLSRSWVDTLKHQFHITTLEQLAGLTDSQISNIGMGARDLVTKANAHLDQSRGASPINALTEKNAVLEKQLAALSEQLAEVVNAQNEAKRKPGRPRKDETEAA